MKRPDTDGMPLESVDQYKGWGQGLGSKFGGMAGASNGSYGNPYQTPPKMDYQPAQMPQNPYAIQTSPNMMIQSIMHGLSGFRAAGGSVEKGKKYFVNEEGKEGFLDKNGNFTPIEGPPGVMTAPEDGDIIPASQIPAPPPLGSASPSLPTPAGLRLPGADAGARDAIPQPPSGLTQTNPGQLVPGKAGSVGPDPELGRMPSLNYQPPTEIDQSRAGFGTGVNSRPMEAMLPPLPTEYDKARSNYESALAKPVEKQGKWAQAGWMGLQAAKLFAEGYQGKMNDKPVQWLGQAKHGYEVDQARARLAPLEAMKQQDLADRGNKAKVAGAEVEAFLKTNPDIAIGIDQGNVTPEMANRMQKAGYTTAQAIDARRRSMVQSEGQTYAVPQTGAPTPELLPIPRDNSDVTQYIKGNDGKTPIPVKGSVKAQVEQRDREFAVQQEVANNKGFDPKDEAKYANDLAAAEKSESDRVNALNSYQKRVGEIASRISQLTATVQQIGSKVAPEGAGGFEDTNAPLLASQQKYLDEIRGLEKERADIQQKIATVSTPVPKPVKPTPRQSQSTTIKRSVVEAQAKKKGMTVEQIMALPGAEKYIIVD